MSINKNGKTIYGNPLLHDIYRIDWVRPEEAIVVRCLKGEGTDDDPIKVLYQYWTRTGEFIGEVEGP